VRAQKSRIELGINGAGIIVQNFPSFQIGSGAITTGGRLLCSLVGLKKGDVIAGISFYVTVNSASLTNAQAFISTVSGTTATVKAVSTDQSALFNSGAANRVVTVPISYTVPADAAYYLCFETTGGTAPTLGRALASLTSGQIGSSPFTNGQTAGTGLTTIAVNDTHTIVTSGHSTWMAAS
jgi:hypothetical protein